MKGKIVLVTGANGGLGKYVTQAFLDSDASVVGVARKIEESAFAGSNFIALPAEITTAAGTKNVADAVTNRFGRLDIVVHTVGAFAGGASVAEIDDATYQRMIDVNLNSTFYLLRSVIPLMRKTGNGRIVGIGSRAAVDPGAGVGAYSASKAAMVSLIRTVAQENKDVGITANAILPGTIDTPANRKDMPKADASKWVQPSAIAALILWLTSDVGKDVNGAVIPIYGRDV
jgi:NAD(P)-dependent dehydrogenase (short-subunit alcohol dehydrogenase family)